MVKESTDNVTLTFIAFKNFEEKMKDKNFEYQFQPKCHQMEKEFDFADKK